MYTCSLTSAVRGGFGLRSTVLPSVSASLFRTWRLRIDKAACVVINQSSVVIDQVIN
jgi:hypothetical protein